MKTFFGDATDLATLRSQLLALTLAPGKVRDATHAQLARWSSEGGLRFPDRLQYTAMSADLIVRLHRAVGEWAGDWLELTEAWESTALQDVSERQARAFLSQDLE